MEKIKAAIAKVKSNKGTQNKKATKVSSTLQSKAYNEDIGDIEYTSTSVIRLNTKHLENNRIVSSASHNSMLPVFDSLRTQILQRMAENGWQTLAIVSPTPDSGKTLVSINLALSIARQPQKTVLLADFDLRKPRIASYLGIQPKLSINDYLEGRAGVEDILINPDIQRLVIMPTMQCNNDASEVLSSSRVSALVNELKEKYTSRIIVFDLPPLLNVDDAMILLPQVDCVLMVVGDGVSTQVEIEDALHLIPQDRFLGTVINKSQEEVRQYYY